MRILWSLALAQLRHHRGRWALLTAGVALVVAVPVVTAGLSRSVTAQTVRDTISRLDVSDRTLLVSQEADSSLRRGSPHQNDVEVRAQLARLTATQVLRELLYRQLTVQGSSFDLGGVDGLSGAVRHISGRLPSSCTPTRCEVVVVGAGDTPALRKAAATLGVVVVGRVERTDPLLVSGQLDTGGTPLLLADGVSGIAALGKLALFGRHYVWAAAVDPDRVVALGVPAYIARGADVDAAIVGAVGGTIFDRPDDQLQQATDRADVSARRFGLLGGFAAVLMLGFAVVAAIGLRRESVLLQTVLARRGATRQQIVTVTVVEAATAGLLGAVLGCVLGGVVASSVSNGTGLGALSAAAHAVGSGALTAGLLTLATAAVIVAVLLWPDAQARAVWRLLDLVAIACLGAAVLAGDRGGASATDLAANGDPIVVALPVLASVIAGLVAARLWGPAVRLAERVLPRSSVAGRIGLLGAVRRPLRPVATVAFLTAAVASVVFAGAYRATLLANDADQAAYRVPLDVTLGPSSAVPVPSVDPSAYGSHVHVYGVLRTSASVTRLAGVTDSVAVVAVDGAALPHAQRWERTTGSSDSAAALADKLRATTPAGPPIPPGTRAITIQQTGADPQTALSLWLRTDAGRQVLVALHARAGQLVGSVPDLGHSLLTVVAFGVDESPDYATHHAHAIGEGNTDQPLLAGRLRLGELRADGVGIHWNWTGWGSQLGTASASAGELRLGYRINGAAVIAVPSFAAAHAFTVPVAVDRQTASDARGGVLMVKIDSSTTIAARVVAQLPRLPTVTGAFVLADRAALTTALDLHEPGRNPTEFWVSGSSTALQQGLASSRSTVTRRAAVQADLDADPVGRGARTLLIIVALLALAVAAVALVLLVVGERRDGAGELYAWEADGTRPRTLRRMLVVRTFAVAAVGVPVGVLAGLVLARVGTTLVAVDAAGSTPTPPLEATLGSVWTPLALVVGIGAGLLAGWLVAAASLRERYPVAAEVDLR